MLFNSLSPLPPFQCCTTRTAVSIIVDGAHDAAVDVGEVSTINIEMGGAGGGAGEECVQRLLACLQPLSSTLTKRGAGEARRGICSLCSSSRSCAGMLCATLHLLAALMLSPRIHLKNSHGDRTCKSKLTRSSEGSITSLVRLQVKVSLQFLLVPIIYPGYGVQMCKFRVTFVGKHAHVCFTRKRSRLVKSIPLNSLGRYLTHVN